MAWHTCEHLESRPCRRVSLLHTFVVSGFVWFVSRKCRKSCICWASWFKTNVCLSMMWSVCALASTCDCRESDHVISWGHYQILCSLHLDASLGNAQHGCRLWTEGSGMKWSKVRPGGRSFESLKCTVNHKFEIFGFFHVQAPFPSKYWFGLCERLSCPKDPQCQFSFHVQPSIPCAEINDAGEPMTSLLSQKFGLTFQFCYVPWTYSEPFWAAPNGSAQIWQGEPHVDEHWSTSRWSIKDGDFERTTACKITFPSNCCVRATAPNTWLNSVYLLMLFVTASYDFMRFRRTVECCCLDVGASQENNSRHLLQHSLEMWEAPVCRELIWRDNRRSASTLRKHESTRSSGHTVQVWNCNRDSWGRGIKKT